MMKIFTAHSDDVPISLDQKSLKEKLEKFPWWFIALMAIIILAYIVIATSPNYKDAFNFIRIGLSITITTTLSAFAIALFIGLLTGLGRISQSVFFRNLATLYVEFIRGVPMLVLIFFIALVGVPTVVNGLNALGHWLADAGVQFFASPLALENKY